MGKDRSINIGDGWYFEGDDFDVAIKQHQTCIAELNQQIDSLRKRIETLTAGKKESYIFATPSAYDKYLDSVKLQREVEEKRKGFKGETDLDKKLKQSPSKEETDMDKAHKALEELKYIWPEVLRCYEYAKRYGAGGDFGDYYGTFSWTNGHNFSPTTDVNNIHPSDVARWLSNFYTTLRNMKIYIERIHKFHHTSLALESTRLYVCPCGKSTCRGYASEGTTKCGIKINWDIDYYSGVSLDDKIAGGKIRFGAEPMQRTCL